MAAADDAASLREALRILGDWENDVDGLLDAPVSPPARLSWEDEPTQHSRLSPCSSHKRTAVATEYRVKKAARNAKVSALQTEIEELHRRLEVELGKRAGSRNRPALLQECEEMAVRQKRRRVTAEAENAALRECVASHSEIARRVVRLMNKAATIADVLGPVSGVLSRAYEGPSITIPQHIRHLDCRMDEAGVVLSTGLFQEKRGESFQQVAFRDLGFDGLQVEFAMSWVVPFGLDAAASALWSLLTCTCHNGRRTDHQPIHMSSDLVCVRFVSEPQAGNPVNCNHGQAIEGTTHGQSALRQYEPARDGSRFFMSRIRAGIFDDHGKSNGELSGDGWIQVEPVTTTTTATTPQVSRIKWCRRVTGRPVDHERTTPSERARWVHSVVQGPMRSHWEKSLTMNMQHVENLLVAH